MNHRNSGNILVPSFSSKQISNQTILKPMKKVQNYYYGLDDQIGIGLTSKVYKGKNQKNNELVAIKVISMKNYIDEVQKIFINEEIQILDKILKANSTYLLRLEGVFKTHNNLYIVSEFCEGKDLAKILREKRFFSEPQAQTIMKQLIKGYSELYHLGIVHRDLKLANILLKEGIVKIADFGFATKIQKCSKNSQFNVGSPCYMAPQALKENFYSFKSDIWALGIIAFELIYGRQPWKDKVDQILYEKMMSIPLEKLLDENVNISQNYKNFLQICLRKSYDQRGSLEQITKFQWPLASQRLFSRPKIPLSPSQKNTPKQMKDEKPFYYPPNCNKKSYSAAKTRTNANFQQPNRQISFKYGKENRIRYGSQDNWELKNEKVERIVVCYISYCRFFDLVYEQIKEVSFPLVYDVKKSIAKLILQKITKIRQTLSKTYNGLDVPNFHEFTLTKKLFKLQKLLEQLDLKYQYKYSKFTKQNSRGLEEALSLSIRELRNSIPTNFNLLQTFTFCYQIIILEKRVSSEEFSEKSKIQLLLSNYQKRKSTCQPEKKKVDRVLTKLHYLDFV